MYLSGEIIQNSPVLINWNIPLYVRIMIAIAIIIIIYLSLWYYEFKKELMNKTKFELMRGR